MIVLVNSSLQNHYVVFFWLKLLIFKAWHPINKLPILKYIFNFKNNVICWSKKIIKIISMYPISNKKKTQKRTTYHQADKNLSNTLEFSYRSFKIINTFLIFLKHVQKFPQHMNDVCMLGLFKTSLLSYTKNK